MKQLLITITAVVLVWCKPSVDIHEAAEKGNIEVLQQHLDAGAQLNAKNESGWTPLIQAALGGHTEVAELLIAEGADANVMDYMGETLCILHLTWSQ